MSPKPTPIPLVVAVASGLWPSTGVAPTDALGVCVNRLVAVDCVLYPLPLASPSPAPQSAALKLSSPNPLASGVYPLFGNATSPFSNPFINDTSSIPFALATNVAATLIISRKITMWILAFVWEVEAKLLARMEQTQFMSAKSVREDGEVGWERMLAKRVKEAVRG
jgi:hypothetical protein